MPKMMPLEWSQFWVFGAQGQEQTMRPVRTLQPLEQLRAAGGAKAAGRRARSRTWDPCAAYSHWNN